MQYTVADYETNAIPQSKKTKGLMRDINHSVRKGLYFLIVLPLNKCSCKKVSQQLGIPKNVHAYI